MTKIQIKRHLAPRIAACKSRSQLTYLLVLNGFKFAMSMPLINVYRGNGFEILVINNEVYFV